MSIPHCQLIRHCALLSASYHSSIVPPVFCLPHACAVVRGHLLRSGRGSAGLDVPHVYTARVNALLDIDQYLHMNNAATLVHLEMARWEMGIAAGLSTQLLRDGIAFLVASNVVRYRRPLLPLQRFEVHSQLIAADDTQLWLRQLVLRPDSTNPVAGGLVRAVLRDKHGGACSPISFLQDLDVSPTTFEAIQAAGRGDQPELTALHTLERLITDPDRLHSP